MIDGTYDLIVNTPLGERKGSAELKTEGAKLFVDVKIKGFPRQQGEGTFEGDTFTAEGSARVPLMGSVDFQLTGTVVDDLLDAECKTSKGDLHVAGMRK